MNLPKNFLNRMKKILNSEYQSFIDSYNEKPSKGIRLNSLKCDYETLKSTLSLELRPTEFSPLLFTSESEFKFGNSPAHHAGMFYSQEPSAASAVTILNPQPGDKVLDLCAAPGGKSTQIGALLDGNGLLWSNEIVKSRAKILMSNIERMGIRNAVVSSCHPQRLCEVLQGYFDKVLVDAPCSGEGMFRKDAQAALEWSESHVKACAERQGQILDSAALAVKESGELVYSTCTFSYEENEGVVNSFLDRHPEFELVPINVNFGRKAIDISALRIYPMDKTNGVSGEGHFVAKLRRIGKNSAVVSNFSNKLDKSDGKAANELYNEIFISPCSNKFYKVNDVYLILPDYLPDLKGLGVLRAGVEFAREKQTKLRNKILEPSHGAFMASKPDELKKVINPDENDILKFLHGEEILSEYKGYTAVAINGVITGFGKSSGGRLKNKYPKGLRINW